VDGGHKGSRNYAQVIRANGKVEAPRGKTARLALKKGDVLRIVCASGGGWGNPKKRSKAKLREDVKRIKDPVFLISEEVITTVN
jgi:N-methylhydantoinase B